MSGKYVARLPRSMPVDQARALSDVFQDLSRDATQYQAQGSGAVVRAVRDKLAEFVSVKDFGAVGDGVADDTAALNAALATGAAFIPEGCNLLISSNVVMPAGSILVGGSRYSSQITLSGNIEGITMQGWCELGRLRIIGNTSMTTDAEGRAKACLLLGTTAAGAFRFRVHNLIVGGKTTEMDATNTRCTGAGIKVGAAFLGTVEDVYVVNNDVGIEQKFVTGVLANAMMFKQIECHSNRIGARLGILNGVVFDACTFENNDEEGLILGGCRSVDLIGPYFELNNKTAGGARRADLLIEADATYIGTTDVGGSVRVRGGYFFKGTNALYGIYADKQRGVVIEYPYMVDYTGATNVIKIGTNNTSGRVEGYYNNSSVPADIPSNFIHGNYEQTGLNRRGQQITPLLNTKEGTTAPLAPAGTADLFTPSAGETYLLTIFSSNNNSGFHWNGVVTKHSDSSTVVVNAIGTPSNISVAGSAGAVRMTNGHGSATVDFAWSALRLK